MAKASDIAKEKIINSIVDMYPNSAVVDKKLYVNLDVEGEAVQIAISLTAPKTKVDIGVDTGTSSTVSTPKFTEEGINAQMKEVEDIFDFFKL